jgi:transposase
VRLLDARQLVFVDECGTHTSITPGATPELPRGREPTVVSPVTAARTHHALGEHGCGRDGRECLAIEGATTKAIFEAYVERVLAPALLPGRIVVMDNLTAHKGSRVRELVEERGCELLYLPPYSPDFSPIEEAFSKVKAVLKKACARTRGALVEAIAVALSGVTAEDAKGFFGHCGYLPTAQLS